MTIDPSLPPITRLYQACEPLESLHPDDPRWVDFDAVRGEDNVVDSFARDIRRARADGANVRAFEALGGVPVGMIRYDNLTPAVIRVALGRERLENPRFVALRSHYGFDSFFCIPGIEGAHEKGGVEGEIGRFRRRHLTPVPHVGWRILAVIATAVVRSSRSAS